MDLNCLDYQIPSYRLQAVAEATSLSIYADVTYLLECSFITTHFVYTVHVFITTAGGLQII